MSQDLPPPPSQAAPLAQSTSPHSNANGANGGVGTNGGVGSTTPAQTLEELSRVFNTAVLSSRENEMRDFSSELYQLMQSRAFKSILFAIRQSARENNLTEKEAAEEIISTFRKVDRIWSEYLFQEGMDRVKNHP